MQQQAAGTLPDVDSLLLTHPLIAADTLIEYLGRVTYTQNERNLAEIKRRMAAGEAATLVVTSAGGPSGTAMSFYDTVRTLLKAPLTTVGSGDVDSSGLIIFLAGERRYVTAHTTSLLHLAGRIFDSGARYTAPELRAMADEDERKDAYYAGIVAERSAGRLTPEDVLELMKRNTVLAPQDFVRYGLAHAIL